VVFCLVLSACTTSSYTKGDGTEVTVKRFAGVPYLEEDVKTEVVPLGSEANPIADRVN
jgi:hypothetical protein